MATGDYFYTFDAYNAAQQQNQQSLGQYQNVYASSTNTSTTLSGLIGGASITSQLGQALGVQFYQTVGGDVKVEQIAKQVKRAAKGILSKLRSEIDDWHGDVLERCPA